MHKMIAFALNCPFKQFTTTKMGMIGVYLFNSAFYYKKDYYVYNMKYLRWIRIKTHLYLVFVLYEISQTQTKFALYTANNCTHKNLPPI